MPEVVEISDADFAEQMLGLVHEAELAAEGRAQSGKSLEKPASSEYSGSALEEASSLAPVIEISPASPAPAAPLSVSELLRPVIQGLQAMGRATGEHGQILMRLDQAAAEKREAEKELPRAIADLRVLSEQRNAVSRQMFDALHEELKSYKDGFLLDTVHRPMIRDLITLYDDLSLIHQQMKEPIESAAALTGPDRAADFTQRLMSIGLHIEHNLDFILEVLARLDVAQLPLGGGKLDKRTQRAVALEPAEDPDDDLTVVRTIKRGFLWKERVVRAEEVVIRKWKEGFLVALKPTED